MKLILASLVLGLVAVATASSWRDIPVIKNWLDEISADEADTFADINSPPIVTIKNGSIQGQMRLAGLTKPVYRYLSIPYAKAPVGDLRFEVRNTICNYKIYIIYKINLDIIFNS